jgi:gliding motility-associated-like protein
MFLCVRQSEQINKGRCRLLYRMMYLQQKVTGRLFLFILLIFASNKTLAVINLSVTVNNVSSNYFSGESIFYNGSITIIASGGTAPYTYDILSWAQNNNGYFADMPPGVYQAQVTDASGQTANATITISSIYPVPKVATSNIILPSACNSTDGGFTLIPTGGTAPYLYSIDGGVTFTSNNVFTNLRQGLYNGILKDANGLVAFTRIHGSPLTPYFFSCNCCSFKAFAQPCTLYSCSSNNVGCIQAYPVNTGIPPYYFSGIPPYKYSLDNITYYNQDFGAGGFYSHSFIGLPPGPYNVYIKDSTGALYITNVAITEYCRIQISYISVEASCQQSDGTISITATNGVAPYSYTMDGINYQASNTFNGLASGVYTIGVKDANGVTNSSTAIVYNKCPIVSADKTDDSCGQAKGTISAMGIKGTHPYLFSIDRINYQTDSVFNGLIAGIYTVILKDANGFMDSTIVTIYNNCLKVATTSTNETCGNKNGTITATGTGGAPPYSYSIDGINFQTSVNFTGLSAGEYTITIKDAIPLTGSTKDTLINIAAPTANAASTIATCNGTGATITATGTGGTPPFLYSLDSVNYQTSNIFINVNAGNYVVKIKDANDCIAAKAVQVTKYPLPAVFIGNDTALCSGNTFLLNAPTGIQYQYQWQDNSSGNSYTVTNTGLYWLKVTNQYNCSLTDSINIRFRPLPVFTLGIDTSLCFGQTLNLKMSIPQASYLWSTGSTLSSLLITTPGLFWLKVSDSGCIKTDSITVGFKPVPIVNLGRDTAICEDKTILLNAANSNSIYQWQDNATTPTYLVTKEGSYFVAVTKEGCLAKDTININYNLKPKFTLGADSRLCAGSIITLDPKINNVSYLWQDGATTAKYTVIHPGQYSLTATNNCGPATDYITIGDGVCSLYVPNSFTPNSDTKNDFFKPGYGDNVTEYRLQVFNRYGQIVFSSTDKNKGWDGTYKGAAQPNDSYVWMIQYKTALNNSLQKLQGTVLLIR